MARLNAAKFGIMGAVLGGLQFSLTAELERVRQQAELQKEQRLLAIQRENEERANQEWTRRNEIESENQLTRDELNDVRQQRLVQMQLGHQASEKDKDRHHDLVVLDEQEESIMRREEHQTVLADKLDERKRKRDRSDHVYTKTFDAVLDAKAPGRSDKGIYGKSGKWYPVGTNIPENDKPTAGFGVTFAPSDSKAGRTSRLDGRRGQATAPGVAAPSAPAAPAGHTVIGRTPDGRTVYRGPDGQMYTEE